MSAFAFLFEGDIVKTGKIEVVSACHRPKKLLYGTLLTGNHLVSYDVFAKPNGFLYFKEVKWNERIPQIARYRTYP
ncbi:hypothetical protein SAMN05216312_102620 [Cohnella sp. OV330]|nr:hypothetical protein SAMN05216312_102620 [Cohnella sp. OV330]